MRNPLSKVITEIEPSGIRKFFDINPYQIASGGSLLMAAEDGNRLVMDLAKEGIPAVVVGKATAGNDRVLINEEERRFLEPPRAGLQVSDLHI